MTRLRIGHAGVQAYLERFKIISDESCTHCGRAPETILHFFFFCDEFDVERAMLENKLNEINVQLNSLRTLLAGEVSNSSLDVIKAVLSYIKDCGKQLTL